MGQVECGYITKDILLSTGKRALKLFNTYVNNLAWDFLNIKYIVFLVVKYGYKYNSITIISNIVMLCSHQ